MPRLPRVPGPELPTEAAPPSEEALDRPPPQLQARGATMDSANPLKGMVNMTHAGSIVVDPFKHAMNEVKRDMSRRQGSDARKSLLITEGWGWPRKKLAEVMNQRYFETTMGAIIMINVVLIIYETDVDAQCYPEVSWMEQGYNICPWNASKMSGIYEANLVLLVIYTLEAACRIYVERLRYFCAKWNLLDFFVVISGIMSEAVQGMSIKVAWLRIFRIARLTRAFRVVLSIRELYLLMTGIWSSARALFFGTVLLFSMLLVWSIILVEFAHPVNAHIPYEGCERCPKAFATVMSSVLTLFQQIITGDSWGLVSIPVIEASGIAVWYVVPILVGIVVSVSLGVMNLILAVIVQSATEAREMDVEQRTKERIRETLRQKSEFLNLCKDMDKDGSGTITVQEMHNAWEESEQFQTIMTLLDVGEDDINDIFSIFDVKGTGELDYKLFVDQLYQLKNVDQRMMLSIIKMKLVDTDRYVQDNIDAMQERLRRQDTQLKDQSRLLGSIDLRLAGLCSGYASSLGSPRPEARGGAEDGALRPPPVLETKARCTLAEVAPPVRLTMPGDGTWRPPPQDEVSASLPTLGQAGIELDLSAELLQLQRFMVGLRQRHVDVLREAERHVDSFSNQAALLARCCQETPQLLGSGIGNDNAANGNEVTLEIDHGGYDLGPTADMQMRQLRHHAHAHLARSLQELERNVQDEASALASGKKLLGALLGNLQLQAQVRKDGQVRNSESDLLLSPTFQATT